MWLAGFNYARAKNKWIGCCHLKLRHFRWIMGKLCVKLRAQVQSLCLVKEHALKVRGNRPVAGPWTQYLQRLPLLGAYTYIYLYKYTYIMLCCTWMVYMYYVYIVVKAPLWGPQNKHIKYTTRCITLHRTCCMYIHTYMHTYIHTYIHTFFENELRPTTAVQQRQHMDAVGCHTCFSVLISMSVFNIFHNPSTGCT